MFTLSDVCRLRGGSTALAIPSEVRVLDGRLVHRLWPQGCESVAAVFEDGSHVERIEDSCFRGRSLTSIQFPASLNILGQWCFAGLPSNPTRLGEVIFDPDSRLERIEDFCFWNCLVQSLRVPPSVDVLGKWCFARSALEVFEIGADSRLRSIGSWCFERCQVKSLFIPKTVESRDGSVFASRNLGMIRVDRESTFYKVESDFILNFVGDVAVRWIGGNRDVLVPMGVRQLGHACFSGAWDERNEIGSVEFEEGTGLSEIGISCFQYCRLRNLTIPASVSVLGDGCFGCARIETLVIQQMPNIQENCYLRCHADLVRLPASAKELGPGWFAGAEFDRVTFEEGSRLRSIKENCFSECAIVAIDIPASIKLLGSACFANCRLKSFRLPGTVDVVNPTAFARSSIDDFRVDSTNKRFTVERGFLIDRKNKTAVRFVRSRCRVAPLALGIDEHGDDAPIAGRSPTEEEELEQGDINGRSVRLPDEGLDIVIGPGLCALGPSCFEGSFSVETVKFESGRDLERIEHRCFAECSLQMLCIPNSVQVLGSGCFQNSQLQNITFADGSSLTRFNDFCFAGCRISAIIVPVKVSCLGCSCFAGCRQLKTVTFPQESKLTRIEDACFKGTSLDSLFIPRGVLSVGKCCFAGEYERPNRMVKLGFAPLLHLNKLEERCFWNCHIQSIVVPCTVLTLGRACFAGHSWRLNRIESLSFQEGSKLERIEDVCFAYCALGRLRIPSSVKVLERRCFFSAMLQEFVFESQSKLEHIDEECFKFSSVTQIDLPISITLANIAENAFGETVDVRLGGTKAMVPWSDLVHGQNEEEAPKTICMAAGTWSRALQLCLSSPCWCLLSVGSRGSGG
jgi:hypothetical protein